MEQDPQNCPMLMIMVLNEDFEFLYKDKDNDDEDDSVDDDNICGLTVRRVMQLHLKMSYSMQAGQTIQVKPYTVCLHTL